MENKKLKEENERLNNELKNAKKEIIDNKALFDKINFEHELLIKKYENLST